MALCGWGGLSGLARFDGYNFVLYEHDPEDSKSINGNDISSIFEAQDGTLWVATKSGLNRYDRDNNTFDHPFNVALALHPQVAHLRIARAFTHVIEAHDGTFWLDVQNQGILSYHPVTQAIRHYQHLPNDTNSLNSNRVLNVYQDRQLRIWVPSDKGLNLLELSTGNIRRYQYPPMDDDSHRAFNHINDMAQDQHGKLWLGTQGGLVAFDPESGQYRAYSPEHGPSLKGVDIRDVFVGRDGYLWLGSDGEGLILLDTQQSMAKAYTHDPIQPHSISSNVVRHIMEDSVGDLWVGNFPTGINFFDRSASDIAIYQHDPKRANSLNHKSVLSMMEGASGNWWLGTDGGGMNYFNPSTGSFMDFRHEPHNANSLSANAVLFLMGDRRGRVWAGTWGGGLNIYDPKTQQFRHFKHDRTNPHSLSSLHVWTGLEDSRGDYWVGTHDGGINRLDERSGTFTRYEHDSAQPDSIAANMVWRLFEDSDQTFWVGTNGGLDVFDRDKGTFTHMGTRYGEPLNLTHPSILSIFEDSQGRLWFGSESGLNRYHKKTKTFSSLRKRNGLANDKIFSIQEDDEGSLWLGTQVGLSRYTPDTGTIDNYNRGSWLRGQFNTNATLKTKDGKLVFGGVNGFTFFRTDDLQLNVSKPTVISDFKILNKSVPISGYIQILARDSSMSADDFEARKVTLTHEQSVFSFEFSSLDYRMPETNQYAYKLEGFDNYWVYAGKRRTAIYTNLDAGDYVFRVKASNGEGVWSVRGAALAIRVLPPWWHTWWAYSLYSLTVFVMLAWFVYTQRQKVFYEREKVKQKHVLIHRLTQVDKLKDEFLANTSHELRTPLHGIIGLAESLMDGAAGPLSDTVKSNLQMIAYSGKRLGSLVNDILDFSKLKNQTLVLNSQPVELHSLVDVVLNLSRPLVGDKPLVLVNKVALDLPLVMADENRLQQILHNLVGNAIKFTDDGLITVEAQGLTAQGQVMIKVLDTGIGIPDTMQSSIFESFEQAQGEVSRAYGGTGLGLTITKQLVELHGGKLAVMSKVNEGSAFSFTVPCGDGACTEQERDFDKPTTSMAERYRHSPLNRLQGVDLDRHGQDGTDDTHERTSHKGEENSEALRILVVDDEPVNRQVLINHLGLLNYNVSVVSCGAEALALFDKPADSHEQDTPLLPFDLILLDVMMPRISGYEVCERLRERYPAQELPVIFLTAKNQVTDMVVGFDVGGNDFITKPVAKEELLARVKLHLQLLEVNRTLEQKVQERTQSLQEKHEHLQVTQSQLVQSEKMASLSTLVAGMAHEINNPTNMAHVGLYNLEKGLNEFKQFLYDLTVSDDEDTEVWESFEGRFTVLFGHLSSMRQGTTRVKDLVEGFRLFSHLDEAEYQVDHPRAALVSSENMIKVSYDERVDFVSDFPDDPEFYCNVPQLNQAFMSLMLNACQAIVCQPDGGRLSVSSEVDNSYYTITFADTGIGMDRDTIEHMFDPFFTTKGVGEGTGLGLAICYGVIDQHQGHFEVKSELGTGTTIKVYLPLRMEED